MQEDSPDAGVEPIEGMDIEVRDHLEKVSDDECAYCGQLFGPDEVVIVKEIHGKNLRFCSEECYRDYLESTNFKDEDLDSKDVSPVHDVDDTVEDLEEDSADDEF